MNKETGTATKGAAELRDLLFGEPAEGPLPSLAAPTQINTNAHDMQVDATFKTGSRMARPMKIPTKPRAPTASTAAAGAPVFGSSCPNHFGMMLALPRVNNTRDPPRNVAFQ